MLKRFFILCSGADRQLLDTCSEGEQTKYVGIGATVFFTAVMAFLAATYALFTVFDSIYPAVIFGLVWASLIFNLDRYIVSTLKKRDSFTNEILQAVPRLVLALIIAVVISKPLEIKIFEKEIDAVLLSEQNKLALQNKKEVQTYFAANLQDIKSETDSLKAQLAAKEKEVNDLYSTYIAEAEGTKGTLKIGKGPVFKEKIAKHNTAKSELDSLRKITAAKLATLNENKQKLETEQESKIAVGKPIINKYDGLMARIRALNDLPTMPSLFIMLLFLCVETAPILAKLLAPKGTYDYLLEESELAVKSRVEEQIRELKLLEKTYEQIQNESFAALKTDEQLASESKKTGKEILSGKIQAFGKKYAQTPV